MARKKSKKTLAKSLWHILTRYWWMRWVGLPLVGVLIFSFTFYFFNPVFFPPVKQANIGTSFSKKQADEYMTDWRANYIAILDDLKIHNLRLMTYWDQHEPHRGQIDFRDLDWQIEEATKRGAKFSLAIGLRQPRWPECHQPEWATKLSGHEWKQALYAYMEVTINRYKDHPGLVSWQLENEAVNNWFGLCVDPDRDRVIEEFAYIKKLDPKHPIWMSLSDQHGIPFGDPKPDAFGFSVYRIVYSTIPPGFYLYYPTSIWYHRLRAAIITQLHHKPLFIHELQLEPWGPHPTRDLSVKEQDRSMSLVQIERSMMYARQIGMKDMYTWGSEWWYWRKVNGDNTVWEKVRAEIEAARR